MNRINLCECGCGNYAKPGNRFINGHQNRKRKPHNKGKSKPKPELQLCKCGCGELAKPGNEYINGHGNRGREPSQGTRSKQSEVMKGRHRGVDNSFYGRTHTESTLKIMSEKNKGENSGMWGKRGGKDIVKHHYIYDHSDLSKYTMKMARSNHTRLHNLMRKAGIIVPHINEKL